MLIKNIKQWIKREKVLYDFIKNKRAQRLYVLSKMNAPDIVIQKEKELLKQTFLTYLINKFVKNF
ncbi:MAG TPA: hypothetical protein PLN85_04850 [archaeon]|nr:hypothetical protein [archaeon]